VREGVKRGNRGGWVEGGFDACLCLCLSVSLFCGARGGGSLHKSRLIPTHTQIIRPPSSPSNHGITHTQQEPPLLPRRPPPRRVAAHGQRTPGPAGIKLPHTGLPGLLLPLLLLLLLLLLFFPLFFVCMYVWVGGWVLLFFFFF
jgi:hypothetical protein